MLCVVLPCALLCMEVTLGVSPFPQSHHAAATSVYTSTVHADALEVGQQCIPLET